MKVSRRISLMPVILLLAFALAIPSAAAARDDYTVTLNSGETFETLRQPKVAPWDKDMILVITEAGNWIALPKADVQSITASVEQSGIGTVIDSKTVAIGRIQESDDEEEEGEGEGDSDDPFSRFGGFLDRIQDLSAGPEQPVYNTDQFVNPEDAGGTAGFPADYAVEP